MILANETAEVKTTPAPMAPEPCCNGELLPCRGCLAFEDLVDRTDYSDLQPLAFDDDDMAIADEMFRLVDPTPDLFMPAKSWETRAIELLITRHYGPFVICKVLEHAREHGTVECLGETWLKAADRPDVEALLPDAHPGEWDRCDGCWALGA